LNAHNLAEQFGNLPQVVAVAMAGSQAAGGADEHSDIDLYVYSVAEVPVTFRRSLGGPEAEIGNRFWEPGDEWRDAETGSRIDVMYRSPEWIEQQLDRVLVRHEASLGYTTCFWHNVLQSEAVFDPRGWYAALQARARAPYPPALQRAIIAKNHPVLRRNQSSYRAQIALALARNDAVSRNHRVTALLASFFDIWFALEREPHPGEKRLRQALPEGWAILVRAVVDAPPSGILKQVDALLDRLDRRLASEIPAGARGAIAHTAAWVADLERAREFYERWFQAQAGPRYHSARRPFESYFLKMQDGASLELMAAPGEPPRHAHVAISVGSRDQVDDLLKRMSAGGVIVVSNARLTGDGFYEASVLDSEGNLVEIVAG
jgi:predicted enzyme related to lactoylglutathione lyase/predicted nucleotidyltransferase